MIKSKINCVIIKYDNTDEYHNRNKILAVIGFLSGIMGWHFCKFERVVSCSLLLNHCLKND